MSTRNLNISSVRAELLRNSPFEHPQAFAPRVGTLPYGDTVVVEASYSQVCAVDAEPSAVNVELDQFGTLPGDRE